MAGCLVSVDVPSEGDSLEHIPIRESSERCRFFRVQEMSSGYRPNWEWSLWSVFFAGFGVIERLGASERFLVIFRERQEDFLRRTGTFEFSGLELLVGRWRNLRRRRVTWGRGFDFGGGVIVRRLGSRKGA